MQSHPVCVRVCLETQCSSKNRCLWSEITLLSMSSRVRSGVSTVACAWGWHRESHERGSESVWLREKNGGTRPRSAAWAASPPPLGTQPVLGVRRAAGNSTFTSLPELAELPPGKACGSVALLTGLAHSRDGASSLRRRSWPPPGRPAPFVPQGPRV